MGAAPAGGGGTDNRNGRVMKHSKKLATHNGMAARYRQPPVAGYALHY